MAKRLIDANAYAFPGDLINEPTVDAVEVVRCKECRYAEVDDPDFPRQNLCHAGCGWNDAEFFCYYGERKGGQAPQREDV